MHVFPRIALSMIAGLSLVPAAAAQKSHQYDNDTGITINDDVSATPYPSTVTVAGVSAPIGEVKVAIRGLSHTYPADIGMLLVGPGGQSVVLMGRVGGQGPGVVGVNYLFTQDGIQLSTSAADSSSGRYAPTRNEFTTLAFGAPAPAGPWGSSLDRFKGTSANGTWSLYVNDEQGDDAGTITAWSLIIEEAPSYANERVVTIPAGAPGTTLGPATPYPSTATVDGLEGMVRSVRVMITGFTHTCGTDVRYMLQSPSGQTCLFLSRCGVCGAVSGDFIFDDAAATSAPSGSALVPGTYKPTVCPNAVPSPNFAAPAPASPYGTTLSVFNGSNPNGTWKLWVEDLYSVDSGQLGGGWSLTINGQSCPADFNKNGVIEVQDIFDFLNAWFAQCP